MHPDDVARFAALGVTANIQPLWAAYDPQMVDLTIPVIGAERAGWQYPFARPVEEIGDTRVAATYVAGARVFAS